MLRCAICGSHEIQGEYDYPHLIDHGDLDVAIHALTKGMGDEARRLSDVVVNLTRAIPDLHPIIALIERETGRKLSL
jgi:hypothetical protein